MDSPFFSDNTLFDPIELIKQHQAENIIPDARCYTNYMGVKIPPDVFPSFLNDKLGQVEAPPIPANWHTDIAELGAVFRAIELDDAPQFSMIEMGCGWGAWLNNAGMAARKLGKKLRLIGIDGSSEFINLAQDVLILNGFLKEEFSLYAGILGTQHGIGFFPKNPEVGSDYGLKPVITNDSAKIQKLRNDKNFAELNVFSLKQLLSLNHVQRLELLHIDIQGAELSYIYENIADIADSVAYLVIGTHSREIEGRLMELLLDNHFILEIERPAILNLQDSESKVLVDGVQGYRNSNLIKLIDFKLSKYPAFIADVQGVSGPEAWGRWTDANLAPAATFIFSQPLPQDFILEVKLIAFQPNQNKPIRVNAGGIEKIITARVDDGASRDTVFCLHFNGVKGSDIEFIPPSPTSPFELGIGDDKRKLGIGFISLRII